jgi:S-adenosylmethionine:tRNA ribosyltransferase-isomerase
VLRSFEDVLRLYDYHVPPERIAKAPAAPRDAAKLLFVERKTGKNRWGTFRDLPQWLPKNAVLVLNETKVIPARIPVTREAGGRVQLLFLSKDARHIHALSNKKLKTGDVLTIRGFKKFTVTGSKGKAWILKSTFPLHQLHAVLNAHGVMPLPPYIKETPLSEKEVRREYQTVFAKKDGSIAAPTASLHFTKRLLKEIEKKGITIVRITLHVHLGTFAPLTEEQWKSGKLHEEWYEIDARAKKILAQARTSKRPIIATGTTVMRTLESAANRKGHIVRPKGSTRLFIREGYDFRLVEGLITNFHVPKSSLLMLVSAFLGDRERLLDLYQQALKKDFRFFSFGDGMLII